MEKRGVNAKKTFRCETCNKAFALEKNLVLHMQTHSGEKPHKCLICNQSFTYAGNLTRHKYRDHVGFKPFECTECGQRFDKSKELNRHKATQWLSCKKKETPIDGLFGRSEVKTETDTIESASFDRQPWEQSVAEPMDQEIAKNWSPSMNSLSDSSNKSPMAFGRPADEMDKVYQSPAMPNSQPSPPGNKQDFETPMKHQSTTNVPALDSSPMNSPIFSITQKRLGNKQQSKKTASRQPAQNSYHDSSEKSPDNHGYQIDSSPGDQQSTFYPSPKRESSAKSIADQCQSTLAFSNSSSLQSINTFSQIKQEHQQADAQTWSSMWSYSPGNWSPGTENSYSFFNARHQQPTYNPMDHHQFSNIFAAKNWAHGNNMAATNPSPMAWNWSQPTLPPPTQPALHPQGKAAAPTAPEKDDTEKLAQVLRQAFQNSLPPSTMQLQAVTASFQTDSAWDHPHRRASGGPYQCPICEQGFSTPNDLVRHKTVSSRDKSHKIVKLLLKEN